MCSAGASFFSFPCASRSTASLRLTAASVVSLADCLAAKLLDRLAASDVTAHVRQIKTATRFFNTSLNHSRVSCGCSSMISKVDWISTPGRRVAATLQYLVSESSIACATALAEMDFPVRMWCTFIEVKLRGYSSRRSPETSTTYFVTCWRLFARMLATSVAVHDPSATSRSSTGEGADDRSLSVSSGKACPEGVIPKNKSSVTNLTVAFTFGADIAKRITHA